MPEPSNIRNLQFSASLIQSTTTALLVSATSTFGSREVQPNAPLPWAEHTLLQQDIFPDHVLSQRQKNKSAKPGAVSSGTELLCAWFRPRACGRLMKGTGSSRIRTPTGYEDGFVPGDHSVIACVQTLRVKAKTRMLRITRRLRLKSVSSIETFAHFKKLNCMYGEILPESFIAQFRKKIIFW